jgi:gp16 family phage-associated protein
LQDAENCAILFSTVRAFLPQSTPFKTPAGRFIPSRTEKRISTFFHAMNRSQIKTAKQVRAEFTEAGVSVAEWARTHGFARETVVDLLRGKSKGNRGSSHRAAVALGLKAGRITTAKAFKPVPKTAPTTDRRATKAA